MHLNDIRAKKGARQPHKRLGRGIGSGLGKTCGRGHKGQKARAGGYHKVGFEGGQMPLQRRLPKVGFRSHIARVTTEVRLDKLSLCSDNVITLKTLKDAKLVGSRTKQVKIIGSGTISQSIKVKGIGVTQRARKLIESAGGVIEE